jgi:hypothetical protein
LGYIARADFAQHFPHVRHMFGSRR